MSKRSLNRIRVVLAEKSRTNKWLAEKLNVNQSTVSRWVNNKQQPTLKTFRQIAQILSVDVKELFESSK
jgi:DNA-binding XRE family transcriptional regulator